MNPSTALRLSGYRWLAPLSIALAWLFASSAVPAADDYPLAASAAGAGSAVLVLPLVAGVAAWSGWRARKAVRGVGRSARPLVAVMLDAAWPIPLTALAAVVVGMLLELVAAGARPLPDPRILYVQALGGVAATVLGFTVGWFVHVLVAAPAAVTAVYVWLAVPRALEPLWFRQLTGMWEGCCLSSNDLDTAAVLAVTLVDAAVVLVCVSLVTASSLGSARARVLVPAVAVACAVVLGAVGARAVAGSGAAPEVPRDAAALVCVGSAPRVCGWPEHAGRLPEVQREAERRSRALEAVGAPVPGELTERPPDVTGSVLGEYSVARDLDLATLRQSVAGAFTPRPGQACASLLEKGDPERAARLYREQAVAAAWADTVVDGVTPGDGVSDDAETAALYRAVTARPLPAQVAWFQQVVDRTRSCETTGLRRGARP